MIEPGDDHATSTSTALVLTVLIVFIRNAFGTVIAVVLEDRHDT
jgi:hypothetical protein